jgi:hypothetical protein
VTENFKAENPTNGSDTGNLETEVLETRTAKPADDLIRAFVRAGDVLEKSMADVAAYMRFILGTNADHAGDTKR